MNTKSTAFWGGAVLALPLLLLLATARPASAAAMRSIDESTPYGNENNRLPDETPHLDATAMLLLIRPDVLDDVPQSVPGGLPVTGGQMMLYGGGASFGKGALRVGVQGLLGGLSKREGGNNTEWRLRLGHLILEQRYPLGQFMATGGAILAFGQLEGLLEEGINQTRYDGIAYGGGIVAGVRWPRATRMGFMTRVGYEWLPFSGAWKGFRAASNPKTAYDLGSPLAQVQVELSF